MSGIPKRFNLQSILTARTMLAVKSRPRATLDKNKAICIFKCRYTVHCAPKLARIFGVSVKTIRDIWRGRTWAADTWHLDENRTCSFEYKQVGRPKGSKDTKPRQRRQTSQRGNVNLQYSKPIDETVNAYLTPLRDNSNFFTSAEAVTNQFRLHANGDLVTSFSPHASQSNHHLLSAQNARIDLDEQLLKWENEFKILVTDPFEKDWVRAVATFQLW